MHQRLDKDHVANVTTKAIDQLAWLFIGNSLVC